LSTLEQTLNWVRSVRAAGGRPGHIVCGGDVMRELAKELGFPTDALAIDLFGMPVKVLSLCDSKELLVLPAGHEV